MRPYQSKENHLATVIRTENKKENTSQPALNKDPHTGDGVNATKAGRITAATAMEARALLKCWIIKNRF